MYDISFHVGGPIAMSKPVSTVAILTDSNCDLPQECFDRYPLFKLPLIINDAKRSYRDEIDITVEEVQARQKDETFKTSLPRMEDIESTLTKIKDAGYQQVIVLILSDALSSASNLLRLTAQGYDGLDIRVFNSKSGSVGVGDLALRTAMYAAEGVPFSQLLDIVPQLIDGNKVFFAIHTMEYLQRGGRIGRATAVMGGLLDIKPILTFDHDGVICTAAKIRGRKAIQSNLVKLVTEYAAQRPGCPYDLLVCDGGAPEEGDALEAALKELLPDIRQVVRGTLSATLTVHLGPYLLGAGIQFLPEVQ